MSTTADQRAAFFSGTGIQMPELSVFISAVFISLIFIFVMMILKGSFKSWGDENIDTGELFERVIGLILLVVISVYLVN